MVTTVARCPGQSGGPPIGRVYLMSMEPDEYVALGVYDPSIGDGGARLDLLDFVVSLGATREELVAYGANLPSLAGILAIRGGPVLTLEEATERSGLSELELVRLTRAAGFADPDPGARVLTERFVALAAGMSAVATIFGEDAGYQLLRVLGSAMARVADAVISAFLVNVEPAAQREDPSGLAVARANVEAASLLPFVASTVDALFRQHLLSAQRVAVAGADLVGFETQQLVVGFVDLVGFTELGEELGVGELGAMLSIYERLAADTVTAGGGRVIKLIGDEIMYTAPHALQACTIALDLAEELRQHAAVPPVRAGLAGGQVILRDGDVFGPVVNLAARVVKVARPGEVVVTTEVASAAGLATDASGAHTLKGIEGPVELCRLLPR